jgi:hypothetical protein
MSFRAKSVALDMGFLRGAWNVVAAVWVVLTAACVTSVCFAGNGHVYVGHPWLWWATFACSCWRLRAYVDGATPYMDARLADIDRHCGQSASLFPVWFTQACALVSAVVARWRPAHIVNDTDELLPGLMFGSKVVAWTQQWEWDWRPWHVPPAALVAHAAVLVVCLFPETCVPPGLYLAWYFLLHGVAALALHSGLHALLTVCA